MFIFRNIIIIVNWSSGIGAEFGKDNHGSIPATVIGRGQNHLMPELALEPDSTSGEKKYYIYNISFKTIFYC
jgi:hypothetical protein